MSQEQANQIYSEGMDFIKWHLAAAKVSVRWDSKKKDPFYVVQWVLFHPPVCCPGRQRRLTWAVKPKLHFFEHQLLEVRRTCGSAQDILEVVHVFVWFSNLEKWSCQLWDSAYESLGQNSRHHHCFIDEDSMRWLKGLARASNDANLEAALMRKNRARLGSMLSRKRMLTAKGSASKRAKHDAGLV